MLKIKFLLPALCLALASPAFADATVTIKNFDYSPMMLAFPRAKP